MTILMFNGAVLDFCLGHILAMHSTRTDAHEAVRFPLPDRELGIVLNIDALGSRIESAAEDIHPRGVAEE
jgi:hypothetical protein